VDVLLSSLPSSSTMPNRTYQRASWNFNPNQHGQQVHSQPTKFAIWQLLMLTKGFIAMLNGFWIPCFVIFFL